MNAPSYDDFLVRMFEKAASRADNEHEAYYLQLCADSYRRPLTDLEVKLLRMQNTKHIREFLDA